MSLVGPILDGILIALLLVALAYGLRLERQLKTLRSGQEIFARSVTDLDAAAINARVSIAELKALTEESQDLLHGRIVAARELLPKLEQAAIRAERAAASLELVLERQQSQGVIAAAVPPRSDYRPVAPRFAEVVEMAPEPGSVETHIQAIQAALKAARARVIVPEKPDDWRSVARHAETLASDVRARDLSDYIDYAQPEVDYLDPLEPDDRPAPSGVRLTRSRLDRALGDRS